MGFEPADARTLLVQDPPGQPKFHQDCPVRSRFRAPSPEVRWGGCGPPEIGFVRGIRIHGLPRRSGPL